MRILITGGAGYIGSILVPLLLDAGHMVTVIDSFIYGQESLLDCCHRPELKIVRGDARNRCLLTEHIKGVDAILPLACLTGAPLTEQKPAEARAVNLDAVRLMLELRAASQAVIFPTTNSGYGVGEKDIHCSEETPLRPVSLYGKLKVEAEDAVLQAGNAVTLRLATAFGISPRMRLDLLVNDFTYRAVTDRFLVLFEAHFKRNYLHVRDVARAFLHVLDRFPAMQGRPYNVGLSDANLNKRELCEEIKKQITDFYFVEAPVGKDPDQRNYIVSNARIEGTGFCPAHSLPQGIAELVRGFQIIRRRQYSNL